jgi:hypothetical protein
MSGAYALGRLFDVAPVIIPIDLAAGANTGLRVHLQNYEGVAFVYFGDVGTAGEDVDLDIQQHNVSTSGTPADLDVVTQFWYKREATLDNDEVWVKGTQAAASEVDLGDDEGELQSMAVVEVTADQLSDGYEWVSVNIPDPGTTTGKIGCVIAILYGPKMQRSPEGLGSQLA